MTSATKPNAVIFIHGLWIHSAAWQPWIELFENVGYSAGARLARRRGHRCRNA